MMITIMTVKRENQVMHNTITHCPPTNARSLFPNPSQLPFQVISSSLYSGLDILWPGISIWLVQVTSPRYAPSQFLLCTSSLTEVETRKMSLTWDKHILTKNQNLSVLPTPFSFPIQNTALQQVLRN